MGVATNRAVTSAIDWLRTRRPVWLVAVGLGVAAVVGAALVTGSLEGDTFSMNVVNDTDERVQLRQCLDACDSSVRTPHLEPGDDYSVSAALGVLNWWQVRDEAGNVLGCFRIDFDDRPEFNDLYVGEDLVPCP